MSTSPQKDFSKAPLLYILLPPPPFFFLLISIILSILVLSFSSLQVLLNDQ